ncbi:MAG: hypothetical protein IJV98_04960 [Clostridia bacterium]|nr:hypothetical protein [Clostridia bacterium]
MITYEELNAKLILANVPMMYERVEWLISFWETENIPPHSLLEDTFNPCLRELLSREENEELVRQIFAFYERLASEGDDGVRNLLQIKLLPPLRRSAQVYERALSFMLPETLRLNDELSSYLREAK